MATRYLRQFHLLNEKGLTVLGDLLREDEVGLPQANSRILRIGSPQFRNASESPPLNV